MMTNKVHQVLR